MEPPTVQCKDCFNCGILHMPGSFWVEYDQRVKNILTQEGEHVDDIRFNYCFRVNLVVDLSTPRKCGCFTKIREENI